MGSIVAHKTGKTVFDYNGVLFALNYNFVHPGLFMCHMYVLYFFF